jgi:hypothetical protein
VVPLKAANGPFDTLTFTWTPAAGQESFPLTDCPSSVGTLPPSAGVGASTCKFATLRAELFKGNTYSRAAWATNTTVNFFQPVQSGGGSASSASDGKLLPAKCSSNTSCTMTLTGLSGDDYFLRLSTLYRTTNLTIQAAQSGGKPIGLLGAQALIDVTGKAQDVLRRLLVAVDLSAGNLVQNPITALTSGDTVCKRFSVALGTLQISNDFLGNNGNPYCKAQTINPCPEPAKDVAITVDASQSMHLDWAPGTTRLSTLQSVSKTFIDLLNLKPTAINAAVVPFNSDLLPPFDPATGKPDNPTPPVGTPLTTNKVVLVNAIDNLKNQLHCCTEYLAGLRSAQATLSASVRSADKVIVFISDGQPTDGQYYTDGTKAIDLILPAAQKLKDAGYTIYTIGITPDAAKAQAVLQPMSGGPPGGVQGTYVYAADGMALDKALKDIAGKFACE